MERYNVVDFKGLRCKHKFVDQVFIKSEKEIDLGIGYGKFQSGVMVDVINVKTGEKHFINKNRLKVID